VSEGLRARAELTVEASTLVTVNDAQDTAPVELAARDAGAVTVNPGTMTASDDFAYLLSKASGTYFGVGAGTESSASHHHPRFDIDERAIPLMSEIFVRCALKALPRTR
jgi:metal-dependent amidase/aminoacylase/carboxypeptidase family protein